MNNSTNDFKGWGLAPKAIFANQSISIGAKALFGLLASYQGTNSTDSYPTQGLLAFQLGCGEDTIRKYAKELEQFDWFEIRKERGPGGKYTHNVYTIKFNNLVNMKHEVHVGDLPHRSEPGMEKPGMVNTGTNNTIINNTNHKNTRLNISPENETLYDEVNTAPEKIDSIPYNTVEEENVPVVCGEALEASQNKPICNFNAKNYVLGAKEGLHNDIAKLTFDQYVDCIREWYNNYLLKDETILNELTELNRSKYYHISDKELDEYRKKQDQGEKIPGFFYDLLWSNTLPNGIKWIKDTIYEKIKDHIDWARPKDEPNKRCRNYYNWLHKKLRK
ncbi:MAG: helix-turn-helix domain-containing protein [PVC group bacterium]|nr:helix-turn-helix domain-containing protein [PVC group bacterium]